MDPEYEKRLLRPQNGTMDVDMDKKLSPYFTQSPDYSPVPSVSITKKSIEITNATAQI